MPSPRVYLPQNPTTHELGGHIPLTLLVCPISLSLILASPLVTNYGENAFLRASHLLVHNKDIGKAKIVMIILSLIIKKVK